MRDHSRKKGYSPKLQHLWVRPAIILGVLGYGPLPNPGEGGPRVLHHDQLKPYQSEHIPLWVSQFHATLGSADANHFLDIGAHAQPSQGGQTDSAGTGETLPEAMEPKQDRIACESWSEGQKVNSPGLGTASCG